MPRTLDGVKKIKKTSVRKEIKNEFPIKVGKIFNFDGAKTLIKKIPKLERKVNVNPFNNIGNLEQPKVKKPFFSLESRNKNRGEEKKVKAIERKKEIEEGITRIKKEEINQEKKISEEGLKAKKAKAKLKAEKIAGKFKRKADFKKQKILKKQQALESKLQNTKEKSEKVIEKKKEVKLKKEQRKESIKKKINNFSNKLKKSYPKILKISAIILIIFIAIISVLSFLVYKSNIPNDYKLLLIKKLPFPAILVDFQATRYSVYLEDLRLFDDYYEQKAIEANQKKDEINTKEIILEELINKRILENLAKYYHVKIDNQELQDYFTQIANNSGDAGKFIEDISNKYGLTKEIFIKRIIYYQILQEKIKQQFITDDQAHKGADLRINKVLALVAKNRESFEDLARKYSEGMYALKGGDVGYVNIKNMNEKMKEAISGLEKNQVSEVIKEENRYYIVKVYDKKTTRNGEVEYWVKVISINTNYNFDEYLGDRRENAKIKVLVD